MVQQTWFKIARQKFTANLTSFTLHPSQHSAEGILFSCDSREHLYLYQGFVENLFQEQWPLPVKSHSNLGASTGTL